MVGKIIKLKPKKEIRKPGSIKKEGKVINADFKKLKINLEKNLKALPKDKHLDYELFNKCRELIATKLVGHGNYSMDINLRYKKIVYGLKEYRKEIKKLKNSKEIIDLNMNRIIKVFYNELKEANNFVEFYNVIIDFDEAFYSNVESKLHSIFRRVRE